MTRSLGIGSSALDGFTMMELIALQKVIPVYEGPWAGRPSVASIEVGDRIVAWLGSLRTEWYSNGTRYCPLGPQLVGQKASTNIFDGGPATIPQVADQIIGRLGPFPAGMFDIGTVLKLRYSLGRTNTTDGYGTSTNVRMGTAGTVLDSAIGNTNLAGTMPAAGSPLSFGLENESRIATNTLVHKLGTANGGPSFSGATASGAPLAAAWPVPDLSVNSVFVSISTTMGAATTTAPQTGYMDLWVMG